MIQEFLMAMSIPLLRSVGGWLNKSLQDNKITKFELRKLAETVLRTSILSLLIFFGADGFGFDINVVSSGATAVILDLILSSIKENKNIRS